MLLALWVLLSNLDDLFVDLARIVSWLAGPDPPAAPGGPVVERRLAIFVPAWRESAVLEGMVEHNNAAIRYSRFDFFLGVYPNDSATCAVASELEARYANVHVAICPHDGPTSKADCLNWVYQHLLTHEKQTGARFEVIITHDAEDLIHPDSLAWANRLIGEYDMVQIPVLPLATPVRELVHGVYCDEFAVYQTWELPVRQRLGGFLPSCGVGTAFRRDALETLAVRYRNHIFEPRCLTEDYENGFRIHHAGGRQILLPFAGGTESPVATREYFPRRIGAAIRQRTRWMMGIALQSWELHGWRDTLRQGYWFWRDRKGLVSNLVGPVAGVMFLAGVTRWASGGAEGPLRIPGLIASDSAAAVFAFSALMQVFHMAIKAVCGARFYGWRFAAGAPLRAFVGNWLNFAATLNALWRYGAARLRGQPLVWLKTEHLYPSREALSPRKPRLGEILVACEMVAQDEVDEALERKHAGQRLGEYLVARGLLTEADLYEALAMQQNLGIEPLSRARIAPAVTRTLPAAVARKWKVLPFRVAGGKLYVAGPEIAEPAMIQELAAYTSLEIRFQLITPRAYQGFEDEFLSPETPVRAPAGARRAAM